MTYLTSVVGVSCRCFHLPTPDIVPYQNSSLDVRINSATSSFRSTTGNDSCMLASSTILPLSAEWLLQNTIRLDTEGDVRAGELIVALQKWIETREHFQHNEHSASTGSRCLRDCGLKFQLETVGVDFGWQVLLTHAHWHWI